MVQVMVRVAVFERGVRVRVRVPQPGRSALVGVVVVTLCSWS